MGGAVDDTAPVSEVVHVAREDGPVLPVENGEPVESFETEGTIVVFSGADWLPDTFDPNSAWPEAYDSFGHTQQLDETLAGKTAVTVGAFATPKAEEAGQSLNPIAEMSGADLVTTDRGHLLLRDSGVVEAMEFSNPDDVEFLEFTAPSDPEPPAAAETDVSLLGEETALEHFVGLVRDGDILRLALVHVARLERDGDAIFVTGAMHRELWVPTEGENFGTEHTATIIDELADVDLDDLLLSGEDPLITDGALMASAREVEAVASGVERP